MSAIKPAVVVVLLAVAIGAGVFAGSKLFATRETETGLAALQKRATDTAARLAALEKQVQAQEAHAEATEKDNATLREALARVQAAQKAKAKAEPALTRQALDERFRVARALAKSGDPAQALRELIWCWDEGLKQGNSATEPARRSGLTDAWRSLAERYPEARTELEKRRDALRAQIVASTGGADRLPEYTAVLRALKEDAAVLTLFEEIPPGDKRRTTLAIYAGEQLREARRYAEAMEGVPYATMSSSFEMNSRMDAVRQSRNGEPSYFVTSTANHIELLAGSGDTVHARELANRLFAVDNSEATRALVQQKLERAGKPDLLK